MSKETAHPLQGVAPAISISFVTESAVMAMPMGAGQPPVVCRRHFEGAHIHFDAEDGIRAEMAGDQEPVPWYSKAERDAAAAALEDYRDVPWEPDDLDEMIRHVRATAFYEWDD